MAKPVQVRPLVSGGAIPANPLAYLEQLNRARSYQNAYIRAGWSNWKTSLAAAEKQIEQEGENYRKKLDYLAGLQEALTKASADLAALTKERQKTLADLETVGFKAAEDRALEQAKLDAEAGKANADQRNKIYLAKLKEAGDTARLNAELQTKAAIATAEQRTRLAIEESQAQGRAEKTAQPLKTFDINTELIDQSIRDFGRSGANDPAQIRRLIDELSTNITNTPTAKKDPNEVSYSLYKAYSGLVDAYARKKGVSVAEVEAEVASQFGDSSGLATGARIAQGKQISDIYTQGRPATPGGPPIGAGGSFGAGAPIGAATASTAGVSGAGAGQYEAPTIGAGGTLDKTVGSTEYGTAEKELQDRIAELTGTIGKYTPLLDKAPSGDIIKRAQELYAQRFTAPPVKTPTKKQAALQALQVRPAEGFDPIKTPQDPLASTKASAVRGARELLFLYGRAADDAEARKKWQEFEDTDIAKEIKAMFQAPNANPSIIQQKLSKVYTKSLDPVDLLGTEDAMKAFVIYNTISKKP